MQTVVPAELINALAPVGIKRFVLVGVKSKAAFELGCTKYENLYSPTDKKFQDHMREEFNFGVCGGRGLVLVDTDEPETEAIGKTLPPTFTVKSGGGAEKYHRYYTSDVPKTVILQRPTDEDGMGEIRVNAYVVGPGSVHPDTGNTYTVHDPAPIAHITEAQLREAFGDFYPPKEEPVITTKRSEPSELDNVRIEEVVNVYGFTLKGTGNKKRGKGPHGGDNPSSMSVNVEKNTWYCHACQGGGGPAQLIAVYAGIIKCGEAGSGSTHGDIFKEVIAEAIAKGFIRDPQAVFDQIAKNLPTKPKDTSLDLDGPRKPAEYFNKVPGTKKVVLNYALVNKEILDEHIIVTMTDTEQSYVYDPELGTYYEDTKLTTVKTALMGKLKHKFKKGHSQEIIYQIKVLTLTHREDMEAPPELFPVGNGLLSVHTRELHPFTPKYLFTFRSETKYDKFATCPVFDAFITSVECKKMLTVQEFSGYILLNSTKYKKALFLSGPTDSGKTTFSNAIFHVIGHENTCSIGIQHLDKRFQEQRLYQKLANVVGDLGREAFKNISMFKRTTGGDIIEAEIKGANSTIKFVWKGKHWFDANGLPDTKGDADSAAFYNRLTMAAFSKQVPKDQQDKNLSETLVAESSGILNWMLDGLDRLEKNQGFTDKTDIAEIREHYKRESNTVYCFAEDQCTATPGSFIHKGEVFRLYAKYCLDNSFSSIGRSKFYEQLQAAIPVISGEKRKIEGIGTAHVFLNLEVEDAEPSKVSIVSTPPIYPPTTNVPPLNSSLDSFNPEISKNNLDVIEKGVTSGNIESVETLETLDGKDEERAPDSAFYLKKSLETIDCHRAGCNACIHGDLCASTPEKPSKKQRAQDQPIIDIATGHLKNNAGKAPVAEIVKALSHHGYDFPTFKKLKPYTSIFKFEGARVSLVEAS
jgi:P4 family phage/plasmid primase-like protien